MKWNRITAKDNAQIKAVVLLRNSAKERKEKKLAVLEGLRLCTDALDNAIRFAQLFISDSAQEKYAQQIEKFAENSSVCFQIPDSLFLKISDTDSPQGILSVFEIPENKPFEKADGFYIGLENLSDPSNLGAVSRTAEALGINGIILTGNSVDPYAPKSLRASMGTLLRMPLFITDDLISAARSMGLKTYGCVVNRDALPITDIPFAGGSLLLIGNEANGLTETTKANCDVCITIPMTGSAESLNAAAAGAIAMWEMVRRNQYE
ncbi:MAG: RNA methyltransferase [Clostridia bacterium]|nr:RNA methyltransferase [Clostridia bacterium]